LSLSEKPLWMMIAMKKPLWLKKERRGEKQEEDETQTSNLKTWC